jgi:hypothetical protein
MSSRQFPPAATSYPLSFHKPAASCLSFPLSRPLFSITSSLFGQKGGVGIPLRKPSFGISSLQTLFSGPVCKEVTPSPGSLRPGLQRVTGPSHQSRRRPPFIFMSLQIPFSATPLFSHSYKTPGGVCALAERPRQTGQVLTLLSHTFNPCSFMQLRTLSRNGAKLSLPFSIASALFPSQQGWCPQSGQRRQVPVFRARTRRSEVPAPQKFTLFRSERGDRDNTKAAYYSKHLRRSTLFRLSSTRRLPARVPHPRCDPQHLRTCGRRLDEITGCFSQPSGLTLLFPAPEKSYLLFPAPLPLQEPLGRSPRSLPS